MKYQVFVLPSQLFELDEIRTHKNFNVLMQSGFLGGFVINITEEARLLPMLERMAKTRHYTDVKYLKDEETWPTAAERRNDFINSNS